MALPTSKEEPLDLAGLDPCCVREIIERKQAATLKGKLRRYDKSNERVNRKKSVFKSMKVIHTCPTCVESRDYLVLQRAREQLQQAAEDSSGGQPRSLNEEEGDEYRYSDDGLDDDDDFLSEHEAALRKQALEQHDFCDTYGFGKHISESTTHLVSSIRLGFPIVCHFCDETAPLSGLIDLCLEQLAISYPGTKFRRVNCNREDIG